MWDEPVVAVRQQAQQLKKAIESTADLLFAHAKPKSGRKLDEINWVIDVAECRVSKSEPMYSPSNKSTSEIRLSLHKMNAGKQSTAWEVNHAYLEAAIRLWTWSLVSNPFTEMVTDDKQFRVSMASEVLISRIVAVGSTQEAVMHEKTALELWTEDFTTNLSIQEWTTSPDPVLRGPDNLWKMTSTKEDDCSKVDTSFSRDPSDTWLYGWQVFSTGSPADRFALTTFTKGSISTTCAHDIYQSFLCAAISSFDSIGGQTELSTGRKGYFFTNDVVSRLAECFKESGLGSIQDAYLVIVPVIRSKLSLPGDSLPIAYRLAETCRREGDFQKAESILQWAWRIALKTHGGRGDGALAASILELGELYRYALYSQYGSHQNLGLKGIDWMLAEQAKVLPDSSSSPTNIVNRYAELANKVKSGSGTQCCAEDIIAAASRDNRLECLWLISWVEGPLPNSQGRTVLSWAAQRGWPEIVKAALEVGSAVDGGDASERTPLSYAAEHGHVDIVDILLKYGARPTSEDAKRRTPLSYAAANSHVRVMEILLEDRRVTIFTQDEDKKSPLHLAAANGHIAAIELLLQHKTKDWLDHSDGRGHTPLITALLSRQSTTADFLLQNGASPNVPIEHMEPWRWAIKNGEWLCAAWLLKLHNKETTELKTVEIRIGLEPDQDGELEPPGLPPRDDVLGPEVMPYVTVNGTKTKITMERMRDVGSEYWSIEAELCIKGSESRTRLDFNDHMRFKVIALMLSQVAKEDPVTEDFVEAIAGNDSDAMEMIEVLLEQCDRKIPITEKVVVVAARNRRPGLRLLELLFEKRGDQLQITEDVVEAAAGNMYHGTEIMELLFEERGDQLQITEAVVKTAVGNRVCGKEVMELFLRKRQKDVLTHLNEAVYDIAAAGGQPGIQELLSRFHRLREQSQWADKWVFWKASRIRDMKAIVQLSR